VLGQKGTLSAPIRTLTQGTTTPTDAWPLPSSTPARFQVPAAPTRVSDPPRGRSQRGAGAVRTGWADWLGEHRFDAFFTGTFSDEYARAHGIFSHKAALDDFERFARWQRLPGNYFAASEDHYQRTVPHLHGLIECRGLRTQHIETAWRNSRGIADVQQPRDRNATGLYCAKYSLKDHNADSVRFRVGLSRRARARLRDASEVVLHA